MSDDECIALAMLHGAKFWCGPEDTPGRLYFIIDAGFDESMRCVYPDGRVAYDKANSYGVAARAYCKRHKLLPEVTHEDAPV